MKFISVVGARPNFMKVAPLIQAIHKKNYDNPEDTIEHILVHTNQHYDKVLSDHFFEELNIPKPDINLNIGSGSHAEQVGKTMIAFEKILKKQKPDWVIVYGDVNATMAASITAKKEHIKCCHIEAGLRSGDISMPEEINRMVTDRISDLLLTPDILSSKNLRKEGIPEEKIRFVGNIMIDTLDNNLEKAKQLSIQDIISENKIDAQQEAMTQNFKSRSYGLMTLHRPSNVDSKEVLNALIHFFADEISNEIPFIWPVHPRTAKQLQKFKLWNKVVSCPNIILLYPVGYHEMLRLNLDARIMLTDSGGLQEECCVLGTPCLTLRWNTERPSTLHEHGGASILVGNNVDIIRKEFKDVLSYKTIPNRPDLWDGQTAERCLREILKYA
jgi:UDP-N-acetylglucosamine 2-epimerase (non-hydrolysing)